VGDCGYCGRYAFPKGKPVLKEFRVKFECDGNARYPKRKKDIQSAGWHTLALRKLGDKWVVLTPTFELSVLYNTL
jgi:hypothetical protein